MSSEGCSAYRSKHDGKESPEKEQSLYRVKVHGKHTHDELERNREMVEHSIIYNYTDVTSNSAGNSRMDIYNIVKYKRKESFAHTIC